MVVSLDSRLESNKEEEKFAHQPRALRPVRVHERARREVGLERLDVRAEVARVRGVAYALPA